MRLREIDVTTVTAAPPQVVYGLLADGSTWPHWSPVDSYELEQPGDDLPEGVGAIRILRRGRTTGRDQILELIPNRRISYTSLSGLPIDDYVGEVDLERAPDGGTTIRWRSSFYARTTGTGWILERGIRRFLRRCAQGLAEHAASSQR